jgi:hypothetical protein
MKNKPFAVADMTTGVLNALVKNIMAKMEINDPVEAVRRVNSGEWIVSPVPVTYLTLPPTEGLTGLDWVERLEDKDIKIEDEARNILLGPKFKPTSGVAYNVAIMRGELFQDSGRYTSRIREQARLRKFRTPNLEVACLIRENLTDEQITSMGLKQINTMHEPIKQSEKPSRDGVYYLNSCYDDGPELGVSADFPGHEWYDYNGFLFLAASIRPHS